MRADFDTIAPLYRYLEALAFGPMLWRCRVAFLDDVPSPRRVLMAGEGDGRFLLAFLRRHSSATVDYFDASGRMLALARRRCVGYEGRVRFFQRDLSYPFAFPEVYDVFVTHFFLDCFSGEEAAALIESMAQAASPEAVWVVSEFDTPSALASWIVSGLYAFFRVATGLRPTQVPDYRKALSQGDFRPLRERLYLGGLLRAELWRKICRSDLSSRN